MRIFLLLTLLILFPSEEIRAQSNPCELTYKDGKVLPDARMVGLHEDLLLVTDALDATEKGSYKLVNVNKIAKIRFDKGTFWKFGAALGAGAGFVGSFAYYSIFNGKKTGIFKDVTLSTIVLFIIPGAAIGGFIGSLFKNIDEYDVSKMNAFMKAKELKYIMNEHSPYR